MSSSPQGVFLTGACTRCVDTAEKVEPAHVTRIKHYRRDEAREKIPHRGDHILPCSKCDTVLEPVYQSVFHMESKSSVIGIWTSPNGNMAGI